MLTMSRLSSLRNIVLILTLGFILFTFIQINSVHQQDTSNRNVLKKAGDRVKRKIYEITIPRGNKNCDESRIIANWKNKLAEERYESMNKLTQQLKEIKSTINDALRLTKNPSTAKEITSARDKVENILKDIDPTYSERQEIGAIKNNVVCPENYSKSIDGYPFFYTGWNVEMCQNVPPFSEVLSITMNLMEQSESFIHSNLIQVLREISKNYTNIHVHIASKHQLLPSELKDIHLDVKVYSDNLQDKKSGEIWNFLVDQVTTPHVLIARKVTHFLSMDARLERIVREINSLNVTFAGSASRDQFGHWSMNCLQSEMRNYTLKYTQGYHRSEHECVYCDSITGPFVANTEFLKNNPFDKKLPEEILFFDYFVTQKSKMPKTIVCPDSMYYVNKSHLALKSDSTWLDFAKKHQLNTIILDDANVISFSCQQLNYGCIKGSGTAISHCCLEELSNMIKSFMKTCEENNIICELQEGTLLGAVKFGKVLPWERDADITFLSGNFSQLKTMHQILAKKGYRLSISTELWCCVDGREAGGTGMLHSSSWNAELYGQHLMDTEKLHWDGLPPTKILFDGMWVAVPRNPGLYVRNRYGHEIYRHAQHWMTLRHSTGWTLYNPSTFTKCTEPGKHYCLDQYSVDGNIQFQRNFV